MNTFHSVWIAPSIILGLGLARLLSDSIVVFRSRHHARLDWVPMVWAVCIFAWQVQYVWAIIELPGLVQTWRLYDFVLLLGLSLLLFVAGALVLPDKPLVAGETLTDYFQRDGRWALVALSGWGVIAHLSNWTLFDWSPFTIEGALLTALVVLPLVFLMAPSRRLREGITLVNLGLTLWSAWAFSPKFYSS